jgi:hypothetical protein
MSCRKCASACQRDLQVELTLLFPFREQPILSPVCICQRTLVCTDCGYTELVVPATDLEELRKGLGAANSKLETIS